MISCLLDRERFECCLAHHFVRQIEPSKRRSAFSRQPSLSALSVQKPPSSSRRSSRFFWGF